MTAFLLILCGLLQADDELPDWLTDEQAESVCKAMAEQWQRDLLLVTDAEIGSRDRNAKLAARERHAQLLEGRWTPRPLELTPLPAGFSRLAASDMYKYRVLSIVDGTTVLLQQYKRGRSFDTPTERIWLNGVGTSGLTSDTEAVDPDTLAVEMPPRDYATAGGTVDRVRQVRALPPAYLELLWKRHFVANLKGERAAEIAAELRLSVRKSRR